MFGGTIKTMNTGKFRMKTLLLLLICGVAVTYGKSISQPTEISVCDKTVQVDGNYYVKEPLVDLKGIPTDMSIDWKTGNIFFTYIKYDLSMKLYVLRKNSEVPVEIQGIEHLGQSSAVDQTNGIVYLSADDGLYTYDDANTKAVPFGAKNKDIMYLDVADKGNNIYYVIWKGHKVFKMSKDKTSLTEFDKIPNGHGLAIDSENNFYYEHEKQSYILRNGEEEGRSIRDLPPGGVSDFFVDKHDNVWAIIKTGELFKIDKANASSKKVGNLGYPLVNSIGFDADDNIIIGTEDNLIKFERVESNPCSD